MTLYLQVCGIFCSLELTSALVGITWKMALIVHVIWLNLLPPHLSQNENLANYFLLVAMNYSLISVLIL